MKRTFLTSILILAALSAATGADFARAAQDTPESVAKAYFAAMQSGDWAKCASLMPVSYTHLTLPTIYSV